MRHAFPSFGRHALILLALAACFGVFGCGGAATPAAPARPPTVADLRPLLAATLEGKLVATSKASDEIKAKAGSGPNQICNVPAKLTSLEFLEPPKYYELDAHYYVEFACEQTLEDHAYHRFKSNKLNDKNADRKPYDEAMVLLNLIPAPTRDWLRARSVGVADRRVALIAIAKGKKFPLTGSGKMIMVEGKWKFQYTLIKPVTMESSAASAGDLPPDLLTPEAAKNPGINQRCKDFVDDVQASLLASQGKAPEVMNLEAAYASIWQTHYNANEMVSDYARRLDNPQTAQALVTRLREHAALIRQANERFEKLPPTTPEIEELYSKYFESALDTQLDKLIANNQDLGQKIARHSGSLAQITEAREAIKQLSSAQQSYSDALERREKSLGKEK